MISDSTGIPPKYAAKAGFEQKTLGKFTGSLLKASAEYNNEFRNLWKSQPYQKVPFRYGYVDATGNNHMLLTFPARVARQEERPTLIDLPEDTTSVQ
jgi:hypothetical protein